MSQFKLLLRGSALRATETSIGIVLGFITLPLMTNSLGADLYGLWVLIGSVSAMMYLFDIGFASAVVQKIAHSVKLKDHAKTNSVISTALVIYSILSLIIILVITITAWLYNPEFSGLISTAEFKTILILSGLAIAIEFPSKAFAGLIQAHLRHDLAALYQIVFKILSTTTIITLLLNGQKLLAIAIVNFAFSLLSTCAFVFVCRYVYKEMNISMKLVNKSVFKELYHYSAWAFLLDLNRMLKGRMDLFFIGSYISFAAVTVYYVGVRLVDYSATLLHKALSVTLPTLSGHMAKQDYAALRKDLLLFNRINTYAYSLAIIFFGFFGKIIIFVWLGRDFDYNAAYVILIITVIGRLSLVAIDGYVTALYACNMHKFMLTNGIGETVVTAVMLYVFLAMFGFGTLSVAIAIAAPIIVFRFLFLPFLCIRLLKIDRGLTLVWQSYRPILMAIVLAPFMYLHSALEPSFGVYELVVACSIMVVFLGFAFIELQPREKALINRLTKRKFFNVGSEEAF